MHGRNLRRHSNYSSGSRARNQAFELGLQRENNGVPISNNDRDSSPTPLARSDHNGVKFRGKVSECDICCRESDVFAVGKCLHPVCMECGIRLRVLCRNQICPKCRAVIDDLYFVRFPGDWVGYQLPLRFLKHKDAQEYRIHLADDYVVQCYNSYLSHPCVLCDKKHGKRIFDSFALLSQHMLAVHRFEYCGICVENLYLFTVERKFYSRSDLERHMKSGDPDNQSFKGHPQCWFCSTRFLDDEARYKHLRKDHFFCQLCDADGVDDVFFSNHSDLLDHHKSLHFVCEEDQCKVLGLAFRTETELKSHKSQYHAAGPQTITLNFHFPDRNMLTYSRIGRVAPFPLPRNADRNSLDTRKSNCSISSQSSTTPALPADATRSSFSNFMQKFTLESCDFPRLEESTPSSSSPLQLTSSFAPRAQKSKVIKKSQKATTKQEIPANASPIRSRDWFIDDDEQYHAHKRHSSTAVGKSDITTGDSDENKTKVTEEKQSSVTTGLWSQAIKCVKSRSGIVPSLESNNFPSLPSARTIKAQPPNSKSLNSVWTMRNSSVLQSFSNQTTASLPKNTQCGSVKLPMKDVHEAIPAKLDDTGESTVSSTGLTPRISLVDMITAKTLPNKKKIRNDKNKQENELAAATNSRLSTSLSTFSSTGDDAEDKDEQKCSGTSANTEIGALVDSVENSPKYSENSATKSFKSEREVTKELPLSNLQLSPNSGFFAPPPGFGPPPGFDTCEGEK